MKILVTITLIQIIKMTKMTNKILKILLKRRETRDVQEFIDLMDFWQDASTREKGYVTMLMNLLNLEDKITIYN